MSPSRWVLLFVTTTLVGCKPAPTPSVVLSQLDGTYVGSIHRTGNSPPNCFVASSAQMVIRDGKLEYRYFGGAAIFHTVVGDDGSFNSWAYNQGNGQSTNLRGEVYLNSIEADTSNSVCSNHLIFAESCLP
jgi:hypothetical protein